MNSAKNDGSKLGFVSVVILVIFSGLVYFCVAAWEQYKAYQTNQQAKFAQLEQQQKRVVRQQHQNNAAIKPAILNELPQSTLIENIQSIHFEQQPLRVESKK